MTGARGDSSSPRRRGRPREQLDGGRQRGPFGQRGSYGRERQQGVREENVSPQAGEWQIQTSKRRGNLVGRFEGRRSLVARRQSTAAWWRTEGIRWRNVVERNGIFVGGRQGRQPFHSVDKIASTKGDADLLAHFGGQKFRLPEAKPWLRGRSETRRDGGRRRSRIKGYQNAHSDQIDSTLHKLNQLDSARAKGNNEDEMRRFDEVRHLRGRPQSSSEDVVGRKTKGPERFRSTSPPLQVWKKVEKGSRHLRQPCVAPEIQEGAEEQEGRGCADGRGFVGNMYYAEALMAGKKVQTQKPAGRSVKEKEVFTTFFDKVGKQNKCFKCFARGHSAMNCRSARLC